MKTLLKNGPWLIRFFNGVMLVVVSLLLVFQVPYFQDACTWAMALLVVSIALDQAAKKLEAHNLEETVIRIANDRAPIFCEDDVVGYVLAMISHYHSFAAFDQQLYSEFWEWEKLFHAQQLPALGEQWPPRSGHWKEVVLWDDLGSPQTDRFFIVSRSTDWNVSKPFVIRYVHGFARPLLPRPAEPLIELFPKLYVWIASPVANTPSN